MKRPISRRTFLLATAAGVTRLAAAQIEGATVLPPSERLNIAAIGLGGQGRGDVERTAYLGHNIVALCDADWRMAEHSFKQFPGATQYKDYREMLEKEQNIDAVVIATPDHHHAPATLAAIALGKHVYCEKPLTHNVYEARKVAEAAEAAGVATQMGNTGAATEATRRIQEIIGDGAIGPVREVHVWTNRPIWTQGVPRPEGIDPIHAELDWDLWLGPAPERPFNNIYHPFQWRGWWDFGTGALGDIACHRFDAPFKALKLGHPQTVEAASTKVFDESFPSGSTIWYEFAARGELPPVRVCWYDGGLKPPRPDELEPDRQLRSDGILYVGDKGKILDGSIIPEAKMLEYEEPAPTLPRSAGHFEEWLSACKGGDKNTGSNFALAGPLTEAVLLGNVALRAGRKLAWEPKEMRIPNMPEAETWLRREYRAGWAI